MKRPAAFFPIALALGAMILVPRAAARADTREEGPTEIEKCQTISKSGSYKLVNNLTFKGTTGACLNITVSNVTIDLAGFTITGTGSTPGTLNTTTGITSSGQLQGIAVRNGSISGFGVGVGLDSDGGSIVEGLRVFGTICPCIVGIAATGVVKGNTVLDIAGPPGSGTGISATGIITGNYVTGSRAAGIQAGQGSTVIGNTSTDNRAGPGPGIGISVDCPSNVTDNTAVNNNSNLVLSGAGCNNTNNVAP
jgi:hypothetical protein